jgi:hypothetical protein
MAQPNFGLLNTNLPAEIAGSVQRGQDEALRSQMAQQQFKTAGMQQESAQMQLEQAKRDRDSLAKMQEAFVANGKSPDLETNFDEMIKSGIAHYVDIGIKGKQKLMEQKQFANIMGAAAPAAPMPTAAPPMNGMAAPMNALAPSAPAAPVNALAAPAAGPDVTDLRRKRDMLLSMGTTQSIAAARAIDADIALAAREPVYHNVTGVGLVDPRTGRVVTPSVEKPPAPPTSAAEYALAQKDPNFMRFLQDRAAATRTPAQPSAPVAVVDPVTGKQIFVSREEALRGRMTPAAAMESLPPKEIQKREALLPQATQSLKTVNNTMSIIGETVDKLLANSKGISGITGLVGGNTPAITDAARAAKADLEQLKNLAFVQGLTELRAASKTGAGVGNVSNREGDRFENLKASLDRSQSEDDLKAALRKMKAQAEFTAQTMQEAYDSTYSYKTGTPAAQGTGGFKYLGKEGK